MGKDDNIVHLKPFTPNNVTNKQLVIKMLTYETNLAKSEQGQSLYRNPLNNPLVSLHVEKTLNRLTLSHFGFDTNDESVETFRTIFKTYYNSPTDYDPDVIGASYYMKNNKVKFYQSLPIEIGQTAPNCRLYNLDGITQTTLYDVISQKQQTTPSYTVIAAFSLS